MTRPMIRKGRKTLPRCIGEFVGHILFAARSKSRLYEVSRSIEEKTNGNITLRRTTIEEIEIDEERDTNG